MNKSEAKTVIALYNAAKTLRSRNESDWRLASAYCLPRQYNSWQGQGSMPMTGAPSTEAIKRIAYDSTGARSLPKYAAVLQQIATPHRTLYQMLEASNKDLMKIHRVKKYFDELNERMFRLRYNPTANFIQAAFEVYLSIGAYGNGPCFLGRRQPNAISKNGGFFYRACAMADCYFLVNDQGEVCKFFRDLWLTYNQFVSKFPNSNIPEQMSKVSDVEKDTRYFHFVHYVEPRDGYDRESLGVDKYPVRGSFLFVEKPEYVGDEEGYRSFPYLTPRTFTAAGDPYGFAPSMHALSALGTASAVKKTTIKQGQKAVDPAYIAFDDGVLNGTVDARPGHLNYGGVSKEGKPLVHALPTGDFRVSEKILQDERADIEDSFFVFIFKLLEEKREMTATEVIERAAKESGLLEPTMGRLQTEWNARFVDRELDIAQELGEVGELPPELIEAKGEYEIIYTSPLAKSVYAQQTSGFMRAVEMSLNIVNATQDPSHLDHFNFDVAIPEISNNLAVPARWMNDEETKNALGEQRKQAAQETQLIENAGPLAGAAKAISNTQQGAA